jgi:hypothetical protein
VTADATPSEIERAFDFRLACLAKLTGCGELQDLHPSAWEDYQADRRPDSGVP